MIEAIGGPVMSKRKSATTRLAKTKKQPKEGVLATPGNGSIPVLRVKKGDTLKTIYAKARRAFTAADLQKYTEIEEGIPFDQIIAEAEVIHREEMKKRRKNITVRSSRIASKYWRFMSIQV